MTESAPRMAKSGRSFDWRGYRIRAEAGHGDDNVPVLMADLVAAIELWQSTAATEQGATNDVG